MIVNYIIVSIAYILYLIGIFTIPIKRKHVMDISGELILGFPKLKLSFTIFVEILALVLITLNIFIVYSLLVTVVLCGCGVLGAWIIVGEVALGPKYGLYENGIVAAGKFIPYDDIMTFPILNLPKYEQEHYPNNILVVASRQYGNIEIAFDSDEICAEVIATLTKMGLVK